MKPRYRQVTDLVEIAAIQFAGKYRDHLPFWGKVGEVLLVEMKEATCTNPAHPKND